MGSKALAILDGEGDEDMRSTVYVGDRLSGGPVGEEFAVLSLLRNVAGYISYPLNDNVYVDRSDHDV
jgi:hypothetical protein